jgi:hypothetical protein
MTDPQGVQGLKKNPPSDVDQGNRDGIGQPSPSEGKADDDPPTITSGVGVDDDRKMPAITTPSGRDKPPGIFSSLKTTHSRQFSGEKTGRTQVPNIDVTATPEYAPMPSASLLPSPATSKKMLEEYAKIREGVFKAFFDFKEDMEFVGPEDLEHPTPRSGDFPGFNQKQSNLIRMWIEDGVLENVARRRQVARHCPHSGHGRE